MWITNTRQYEQRAERINQLILGRKMSTEEISACVAIMVATLEVTCDPAHERHVLGLLHELAPSFARELQQLIKQTRKVATRVPQPVPAR